MQQQYPLATSTWGEEEIEAGCRVLRSGQTTMGRECTAFESEFADYIGTRYAVMVNSGSSANLLMVAALVYGDYIEPMDPVWMPAVSWNTTYAPVNQFRLRGAVVDVDDSLTIDPDRLPDSGVAFVVNLLGNPCDFDRIDNPIIIEDNCEALGAEYNGRKTGSIGLMASHSLFFSHHISTMEGGVITTDDARLYRILVSLRAHGWSRDWAGKQAPFEFHYPGYSVRPTEVQGAIGRVQLRKLPTFLEQRRAHAEHYKRLLGHQRENGRSSWFGFAVRADDRDALLGELNGVDTRPVVAGNIQRHPVNDWYEFDGDCPVADDWHDNGFFVGCNPDVPAEMPLARIARALRGRHAA